MLEELVVFVIILFISLFFNHLVSKGRSISPFYGILVRLMYIGVLIHEVSHYLISLLVGIKPRKIEIKFRDRQTGMINPHGYVEVKPRNFLQAFLLTFAPLYISTWLAVLFFNITAYSNYWFVIRIIACLFLISTIIGAAPSSADLSIFYHSIRYDALYTLYQIFLIALSIFILWTIIYYFEIVFFLDVFYYFSIAAIYWELKLGFMGVSKAAFIIRSISYQRPHKLKVRSFARRRYKPQKPHKIGIEEAPW